MGDSTPATQTTQTSSQKNPWAPAQQNLQDILSKSSQLANDSSVWTPTYSDATTGALNKINAFANGPNYGQQALQTGASGAQSAYNTGLAGLTNTANGGMMGRNPYLDAVNQYTGQNTADAVQRQFSGMGRLGSAADTGELTRQLGAVYNTNNMNNYNTQLGAMNQAQSALYSGGQSGLGQVGNLQTAALQPSTSLS